MAALWNEIFTLHLYTYLPYVFPDSAEIVSAGFLDQIAGTRSN